MVWGKSLHRRWRIGSFGERKEGREMAKAKTKKYSDIRGSLETGDIVLFSGKGGISSAIKWFTASGWSHVGMVLRLPEWNMVLLWESTTLGNLKDVTDRKAKQGVQLVALSERVATYKGEVSVRHLKVNRTDHMKRALLDFRKQVKNRPYEKSRIELIKAAYDGPLGENIEDLSSLFCSELVAEAYQRLGLLSEPPRSKPSNEYTPKDFSSAERLPLLQGATLSAEITLRP
jgi:hypothetical protein